MVLSSKARHPCKAGVRLLPLLVIPAQAGMTSHSKRESQKLDSSFRWNDERKMTSNKE
jgi:hypothetical protein